MAAEENHDKGSTPVIAEHPHPITSEFSLPNGCINGGPVPAASPVDGLEGQLRNLILHNHDGPMDASYAPPPGPIMPVHLPPGYPEMIPHSYFMPMAIPPYPPPPLPPPLPLAQYPNGYPSYPPQSLAYPSPGESLPVHYSFFPYPAPPPAPFGQFHPPNSGYFPIDQNTPPSGPLHASGPDEACAIPQLPQPEPARRPPTFARTRGRPHANTFSRRFQAPPSDRGPNPHQTKHRRFDSAPAAPTFSPDDFPPLGSEKAKVQSTPNPQTPQAQPPSITSRERIDLKELFSHPPLQEPQHSRTIPTGPRRGSFGYYGRYRRPNHVTRRPFIPYQPTQAELAILNEVANERMKEAAPPPAEVEHKNRLVDKLQKLCRRVAPTAILKPFGSLVSGLTTVNSDVDLVFVDAASTNGMPYFEVPLLLEKELKENGFEAELLSKTRVPILKVLAPPTEEFPYAVPCDIGFGNELAVYNTQLVLTYSKCDSRVKDMVRFVKWWARKREINNPYRGTLSSYGYVIMTIHYLINIVQPSVLPNLQLYPIPKDTPIPEITTPEGNLIWYWKDHDAIETAAAEGTLTSNNMDIASLLLGFYEYYAWHFDWAKDVISIRTAGGIMTKLDKGWVTATIRTGKQENEYKDRYLFAIEDPFEINHNVSRTCNFPGVKRIREEFKRANRLMRFKAGEYGLRHELFADASERPHGFLHDEGEGGAIEPQQNGTDTNGDGNADAEENGENFAASGDHSGAATVQLGQHGGIPTETGI